MNVGELFINLGIKGSEKTVGAIAGVHKGMSELASTSIETKAAILGAMYGLERLMSMSGNMGTALTNFNALTGQSSRKLQQWQYAMVQAGGTAQDVTSAVMNIQKAMARVDLNKGVPEGLFLLSKEAGGIDYSKKDDPYYMLDKIQTAVRNMGDSPRSKAIANYLASTMALNDNVIAGMHRNAFRPDVFAKAPTYSDKEISALNRANVAWSNLGLKIEMAVGHFNAKHGGQLVQDITKIADQTFRLIDALTKLAEKLKVFQILGGTLNFLANLVGVANEEIPGGKKDRKSEGYLGSALNLRDRVDNAFFGFLKSMSDNPYANTPWNNPYAYIPPQTSPAGVPTQHIQVKQNLNFNHDGKDHKRTAESTHKAVQQAFRQIPAIGQGS